jgi:hypothetical protein
VLVNNVANFFGGFFEELAPEQIDAFRDLSTSLAYEDSNAGVA